MTVLLDAFALIALLADEAAADDVEAILRRGEAAMTAVNLAERAPISLADSILMAATGAQDSLATADAALIRVAQAEQIAVTPLTR